METRAPDDRKTEGPARRAVELAEALLREARAQQTPDERAQARKLARMMADPHGKELTIALADQAFRSHRPERIADQLAYLLERYGVPQYMDWWERVGAAAGRRHGALPAEPGGAAHRGPAAPRDAERDPARARRRTCGATSRSGAAPACASTSTSSARRSWARRRPRAACEAYLALLARDDVEYISVKVSSRLQPDRPRRLPRDGGARGRAPAHALPGRRRAIATATPTGASRRSSSTSTWRSTATSTSRWRRSARCSTSRSSCR